MTVKVQTLVTDWLRLKNQSPWPCVPIYKNCYNEAYKFSCVDNPVWSTTFSDFGETPISTIHNPYCGYWPKLMEEGGGITPTVPPLNYYWQQSIDIGEDGNIYWVALNRDNEGAAFGSQDPDTGTNTYYDYLDTYPIELDGYTLVENKDLAVPVRGEDGYSFFVEPIYTDVGDTALVIETNRSGIIRRKVITVGTNIAVDSTDWAEGLSNGTIVCVYYDYEETEEDGFYQAWVARSINYGQTWINTKLFEISYNDGYIQLPPVLAKGQDDKFYAGFFLDDGSIYVYSSTDGYSWDNNIISSGLTTNFNVIAICASSDIIYVGCATYGVGKKIRIYYSSNGGDSWSYNDNLSYDSIIVLAVNEDNLIIGAGAKTKLLKSTDNGANISLVYDISANGVTDGSVESLRNNGSVFTYSSCSMQIDGELLYLISTDDGDHWEIKYLGLSYNPEGS